MSQELHYTSVPRGLKPGSRGFCTVACTLQMSGPLTERLESLSGYQPVYPVHDPAAARNPINLSHLKLTFGGVSVSVLSRVGPAGLDYSGRSNKYAHHVVLEANERPEGGPAWLLSHPGFLQAAWEGEPRVLPEGRRPPRSDRPPGVARAWQALAGDAGWAGVLAESFLADPRRPVFLIFRPGMDLLPLFVEAIALLPPPRRWDVEFSTYFTTLPRGVTCPWRGVLEGSSEAENALRLPNALAINLCGSPGRAEGRTLVHQARTGERRESPAGDEAASASRSRSGGSPSASGRPIPTAGVPPQAPPPGSTIDYEPLPDLAGRLPMHGPRSSGDRGPDRRHPGRTWAMVAGIVAVSLIGMAGSGLVLLQLLPRTNPQAPDGEPRATTEVSTKPTPVNPPAIARSDEPSKGRATTVEASVVNAGPTAKGGPAPSRETPRSGTSGELPRKPAANIAHAGARQDDPNRKTAPVAVGPEEKDEPEAGTQKVASAPKEGDPQGLLKSQDKKSVARVGDRAEPATKSGLKLEEKPKANFSRLEEPGPEGQKSQRLGNFKLKDAEIQLIGAGPGLEAKIEGGADGASRVVVSVPGRNDALFGDSKDRVELATFDVSIPKGTIDFSWGRDTDHEARDRLRDCVLVVRSKQTHEEQFYILRDEPRPPKGGFPLSTRKMLTRKKSIYEVAWYGVTGFQMTKRTLRIDDCRLWDKNQKDVVSLTRRDDGSWHDDQDKVTFRLEGAKLFVELQDDQPTQLPNKIQKMQARITQMEQSQTQQLGEVERKVFQSEIDRSIEDLERLKYLDAIHSSLINLSISWEVGGNRFEIARSEGLKPGRAPVPSDQ